MLSTLFPNFLIGLREGLEAALVVCILIAFLVRTKRQDKLPLVWAGVAVAVALSVLFGTILTYVWDNLDTFKTQELTGGILSIVAVSFVTWMIFWMRKTARFLKQQLNDQLSTALTIGPVAIAVAAFLAVAREGLETALFFWTVARSSGTTTDPLIGFLLGIAVAIVLGWLIYLGTLRMNLSRFFTITGVGLILVAAGILAYGIHDLQEASALPGLSHLAFDISNVYDQTSWYGTLLKGIFNFQPNPTVMQAVAWLAYTTIVLTAFLWPSKTPQKAPQKTSTPATPVAASSTPTP